MPGFSTEQNREITALAESLGTHGLSASAQQRIQDRMNQIAATLAPAARPEHGAPRIWTGAVMSLLGIVGFGYACLLAIRLGKK